MIREEIAPGLVSVVTAEQCVRFDREDENKAMQARQDKQDRRQRIIESRKKQRRNQKAEHMRQQALARCPRPKPKDGRLELGKPITVTPAVQIIEISDVQRLKAYGQMAMARGIQNRKATERT